jgi:hypothetical protein
MYQYVPINVTMVPYEAIELRDKISVIYSYIMLYPLKFSPEKKTIKIGQIGLIHGIRSSNLYRFLLRVTSQAAMVAIAMGMVYPCKNIIEMI